MKRLAFFLCFLSLPASALTLAYSHYDESVLDYVLRAQTTDGWVSANSVVSRSYRATLLRDLGLPDDSAGEFRDLLLARLDRESIEAGPFRLRVEGVNGTSYLNSDPIPLIEIAAAANPPIAQNDGLFGAGGWMKAVGLRIEGGLTPYFGFSAAPFFLYSSRDEFGGDSTEFHAAEALGSVRFRDLVLEGGLGNLSWGTGRATHLLFSRDNEPLLLGRVRSDRPVTPPGFLKFLGPTQFEGFLAFLGDRYTYPNARLFGIFFDAAPTANLELGAGGTVVFGGAGAPTNNPLVILSDYFGEGTNSSANRNFLLTGRYRMPDWGIEPYFEALMEDCCSKALVNPRDFATLVGLRIPRVDPEGRFDLALEWARTSHAHYTHGSFADGTTFKGRSLGSPLGPGALGFYFIGRYFRSPRFILKMSLAYEIRERLAKTTARKPVQTVYPAFQVPDQRVRFEVQPDWVFREGRLLFSPTVALERATGIGYVQNREEYNYLLGIDFRYLF